MTVLLGGSEVYEGVDGAFERVESHEDLEVSHPHDDFYSCEVSQEFYEVAVAKGDRGLAIPSGITEELDEEEILRMGGIIYPRTRNGSVDKGLTITAINSRTGYMCKHCNERKMLESVSALSCSGCGAVYEDYWPNAVSC